jgi:hypothetical protein
MTQSATPVLIPKKSQDAIIQYAAQCFTYINTQWNIREQLANVDRIYMREQDLTADNNRAKQANRYGDPTKLQNVTVPVVLPAVETATAYQTAVFLQGQPIFGVAASPQYEDEALQFETIIANQAIRGGWTGEFIKAFRDGFKYNLAAMEVYWDNETVAALDTDIAFSRTQAKPKEVIWSGNKVKRVDLYNAFWDTRVAPSQVHSNGEFAGYTELMGRVQLKAFLNKLPDGRVENYKEAFESSVGQGAVISGAPQSYFIPRINPNALIQQNLTATTNWMAWAGIATTENKINYKDAYEVTTLYARILPSDFGLKVPSSNTPQVWKFIIINHSVVVYAERCTNAHGYLPMMIFQPHDDGMGYQTKSLALNIGPFQQMASTLWNSALSARRRAVSDRGIYNPQMINEKDINSENPAAKIPVRPAAYGKPLNEAYLPIPFRDDQSGVIMQESQGLLGMAQQVTGQNQARQGQFVKGNKTLHEFDSVMSNANSRDQMCAMQIEAQLMTPLKEMIKLNILQYAQAGVEYNRELQKPVTIDPVALRKASLEFKVSDGLTPTDKLINGDALKVAFQVLGSSPQIASEYNMGPLFSYLMKTQGARLTEFEKPQEQKMYEQALATWDNTCQQIAKAGGQQFPPQPNPAQFGLDPKTGQPVNQQGAPEQGPEGAGEVEQAGSLV